MAEAFSILPINADNWRPGFKHREGYLVRYRPHENFGWLGCRTFASLAEADGFAAELDSAGEIPR